MHILTVLLLALAISLGEQSSTKQKQNARIASKISKLNQQSVLLSPLLHKMDVFQNVDLIGKFVSDSMELPEFDAPTESRKIASLNLGYQILCYHGLKWSADNILRIGFMFGKYGCYCGPGGQGKAVDGIDRCCQTHDHCYAAAKLKWNPQISAISTYFTRYKMVCHNKQTTCYGQGFARSLCECDQKIASCLASKVSEFKFSYALGQVKNC